MTFQMMMNAIFTEEIAEGWLVVYMDNILITMKGNLKLKNASTECSKSSKNTTYTLNLKSVPLNNEESNS